MPTIGFNLEVSCDYCRPSLAKCVDGVDDGLAFSAQAPIAVEVSEGKGNCQSLQSDVFPDYVVVRVCVCMASFSFNRVRYPKPWKMAHHSTTMCAAGASFGFDRRCIGDNPSVGFDGVGVLPHSVTKVVCFDCSCYVVAFEVS